MSHHDHGDYGVDQPYGDAADEAGYTPRHGTGYDDDGYDSGDTGDADQHGRRNVTMAVAVSGVALVLVALMFWLMSSLSGPTLAADATAKLPATTTTTSGAVAAVAPETSVTVPSIGTYTPTTTFSLPPPEQPTMTAAAPQTTTPPSTTPAPTTTQPPAPAPQPPPQTTPAAVAVTNVRLTCAKGDGRKITGTLSFTTNATVTAAVSAGDSVQSKSSGPGDVTLSANGRGNPVCIGKINDQVIGPVPAT